MAEVNQNERKWPWWRWVLTALNIFALIMSVTLSWHYFSGGAMAGCGGGSPCEQVLSSRWSVIAGILPVSGLAVGAYLSMLIASFFIGDDTELSVRSLAWSVMLVLAGAIAGSAVWFTILQKWMIGDFCFYCMTTHITGVVIALLVIWRAVMRIFKPMQVAGFAVMGMALTVIMAAFQFSDTPTAVVHYNEPQDILAEVDYHNVPMIGSPDAPYKVTLLFDYQCSHCQKLHFMLQEAIRQYGGKLAFLLCPTPLETNCNPYVPANQDAFRNSCELAKIGMAVWLVNRDAFPVFENWMFTFESGHSWYPRSLEAVRAKARELVGQEKLDAALSDPWLDQYLQNSVRMFGLTVQNGRGAIPKMIYGSGWVIPEPYNADNLVQILQESLGVPKH